MNANGRRTTDRTAAVHGKSQSSEDTLEPIEAARRLAERERREVAAERRALRRFERRIEDIDAAADSRSLPIGLAASETDGAGADAIERVRDAYRETVMGVAHYERVYDEPFESNIAAEFGPDAASGVCGDSASYTPQVKAALLAAVDRNKRERSTYLDVLDREIESLEEAESTLGEALSDFPEQFDPGDALADLAPESSVRAALERIDSLLARRQQLVHRCVSTARFDGHDLCEHLYVDAPSTYPVLSVATSLRDAIEA